MAVEKANLLTYPTLVETPFIIVKIGEFTFGVAQKTTMGKKVKCDFPNYITSLEVEKTNGKINQYKFRMEYQIQAGDDPNMIDKILSTISKDRKITFSYGDWGYPKYVYQEEEAIITNIGETVESTKISYNISATSTSMLLNATRANFPAVTDKGSNIIRKVINNPKYGVQNVFKGMTKANMAKNSWIPSNDEPIKLEQRIGVSITDYLSYVVSCMSSQKTSDNSKNDSSVYTITYCDGKNEKSNGSYFKVSEVKPNMTQGAAEDMCTYEINIGFPDNNLVTQFSWQQNDNYSILYNYNGEIDMPSYTYTISDDGLLVKNKVNNLTYNANTSRVMPEDKTWWTKVTQFPTKANVTVKGLMRPQMLMSYVKLNVYYYGRKHISSGIYSIVKQVDSINSSGYKTSFDLLKIKGDTESI